MEDRETRRLRWFRRAGLTIALALLVGSVFVYWRARQPDRSPIRIAAGRRHGLFHEAARDLAPRLARRTHRPVRVVATEGSIENAALVRSGDVELALVQATRETMHGVSSLAPFYADVYVVLARRGRGIRSLADFAGRPVAIGRPGSGVHSASVPLLARYGVRGAALVARPQSFAELATDETLDGAIVVTGLLSPELHALVASGEFEVVPIGDGEAIAAADPFLEPSSIPVGMFSANPAVPSEATPTIATTAVLVSAPGAPDALVEQVLLSVYEDDLAIALPTLIPALDAPHLGIGSLHPAARAYHNPYEGMDVVSEAVQAVDAGKELLVAIGAAIYLVVERIRRARARVREAIEQRAADELDVYLERTVALERRQTGVRDREELSRLLDQVTAVKLEALERLASENLRGDRRFLIFLTQCASLVQSLQAKMEIGAIAEERARLSALPPAPPNPPA